MTSTSVSHQALGLTLLQHTGRRVVVCCLSYQWTAVQFGRACMHLLPLHAGLRYHTKVLCCG